MHQNAFWLVVKFYIAQPIISTHMKSGVPVISAEKQRMLIDCTEYHYLKLKLCFPSFLQSIIDFSFYHDS